MYIVLGASRGIGFAMVQYLLSAGEKVLAYSRNTTSLMDLKNEFDALQVHELDLTSSNFNLSAQAGELSQLKGVLYCAGYLVNKPYTELSSEDWLRIYQTNVFGIARFTSQIMQLTSLSREVRHLYIGSMGGYQGSAKFPGLSAYSSSKAALACMAECLAEEFKESKHSFNTLSIGAVQTEMLEEAFPGYQAPVNPKEMAAFIYNLFKMDRLLFNGKNIPVSLSTP